MAVRWWNINSCWNIVDKNFMKDFDILFLLETHCNSSSMPSISGFNVIGDPTFPLVSSHGGTVVYIKNEFFKHIQQIRYGRCTIPFNFTFALKVVFIGVYIYPYDSLNFRDSDFATILCEMDYWLCKWLTPFIGGDFNARVGDCKSFSQNSLKWRYDTNIDNHLNQQGKALINVCEILKILPINHSKYYDRIFPGNYTYFKAGKKSQIDFLITDAAGWRLIADFIISQSSWHVSDHLPLDATLTIKTSISANMLLKRSNNLKPYIPSQQPLFYWKYIDINSMKTSL